MTDAEIIDLFFARSEQAISELMGKYGVAIRRVAANILKDPLDAEETVSDTCHQLWIHIPPTKPRFLGAYTCRVARNLSLRRYEANTAQKRNSFYDVALEELEETVPALNTVETEFEARELTRQLNRFLEGLSREDRFLFLRRYWYGDSVGQIGQELGISAHTASVRLFRLRQKLQKHLEKVGVLL